MRKTLLFTLAALSLLAADYATEGDLWWSHVEYLADDSLQGREAGSEGYRKAAQYVAGKMETFGLKAAGTDGYFQPVQFEARQLVEDQSRIALIRDGNEETLERADATLGSRGEEGTIEAPMVFIGYGLRVPEIKYDELAGLDLKGKIAVYVNAFGPVEAPGPVKSHAGAAAERWNSLRAAGAIGVATIMNPRPQSGTPSDPSAEGGRGGRGAAGGPEGGPGRGPQRAFLFADPAMQDQTGQRISITITRAGGEKFFAGSGHTFQEILGLARENKPLPKFPLAGTLRAKVAVKRERLESPNVTGILPGSDAKLKNEYIVMSAHLDHLGMGRAVNGDSVYNGAMDDGSGIASILEIARIMKAEAMKPKRSIVFLAVTAEEKGELGSRYFATHPTVDAKQIVADINLDMFMPLFELKFVEVQGLAESTLGDTIREAAKEFGVAVQADKEPEQNRFIRSDQYSFIKNGVPALAFKFGYEFGTPEDKIFHDWIRERYHKPNDDLNQPVDKAAAAKFDRMIASLLNRIANAGERPQWKDDSFFKRFAK
jgi:Peptidase family M28